MTNISVIILVGKEERHIGRCLERLAPLEPRQIFVVESQKGDATHEVAVETVHSLDWIVDERRSVESKSKCEVEERNVRNSTLGLGLHTSTTVTLVWHEWEGTQAKQFNWAVDFVEGIGEGVRGQGLGVSSGGWILRLDADEYLTPETIEKLKQFLSSTSTSHFDSPSDEVAGLTLELKRKFCGGEIRHGTNGIRQVRLFRRGKARYAETLMDERLIVEGEVVDFNGAFYDDSLMPMAEWREKHRQYAKREAAQAVEGMKTGVWTDPRKAMYYRLPPYFRAFAYFCIRYFLKGGFLDGYAGWMWNFWQGLWYRWLVDWEISRSVKSKSKNGG